MVTQHPVGVSPFPQPPEYAKQYTDANIAKKNILAPPNVPNDFVVFGEEYNFSEEMIRSLQSQKMQQLFSSTGDWRSELKKLNRSTIAAFLDLLDILVRCPSHPERLEKINNLRLLFINTHHLINEYRPLQARDTLQMMMRSQIKTIEDVTSIFRGHLSLGQEALDQVVEELPSSPPIPTIESIEEPMEIDDLQASNPLLEKIRESNEYLRKSTMSKQGARKKNIALCRYFDKNQMDPSI